MTTLEKILESGIFAQQSESSIISAMFSFQEQLTAQKFAKDINSGRISVEYAYMHFWSYEEDRDLWGLPKGSESRNLLPAWKNIVLKVYNLCDRSKKDAMFDAITRSYLDTRGKLEKTSVKLDQTQSNPLETFETEWFNPFFEDMYYAFLMIRQKKGKRGIEKDIENIVRKEESRYGYKLEEEQTIKDPSKDPDLFKEYISKGKIHEAYGIFEKVWFKEELMEFVYALDDQRTLDFCLLVLPKENFPKVRDKAAIYLARKRYGPAREVIDAFYKEEIYKCTVGMHFAKYQSSAARAHEIMKGPEELPDMMIRLKEGNYDEKNLVAEAIAVIGRQEERETLWRRIMEEDESEPIDGALKGLSYIEPQRVEDYLVERINEGKHVDMGMQDFLLMRRSNGSSAHFLRMLKRILGCMRSDKGLHFTEYDIMEYFKDIPNRENMLSLLELTRINRFDDRYEQRGYAVFRTALSIHNNLKPKGYVSPEYQEAA